MSHSHSRESNAADSGCPPRPAGAHPASCLGVAALAKGATIACALRLDSQIWVGSERRFASEIIGVPPRWYKNPGVPTWNYTAVHLYGQATILQSPERVRDIVDRLTELHEQHTDSPWQPEYPDKMLAAITGFEIEVDDIHAKFKLSQNRPEEDIEAVIEQLEQSGHQNDAELAALMRGER